MELEYLCLYCGFVFDIPPYVKDIVCSKCGDKNLKKLSSQSKNCYYDEDEPEEQEPFEWRFD